MASVGAFSSLAYAEPPPVALSPKEFRPFKLLESETLTHNTKRLRFALPSDAHVLGLPITSCLTVSADGVEVDGKPVMRPYTPVSRPDAKGYVDLIVKDYPAPAGVMSRHINNLKPGESINFKGPWKKLDYTPNMYKQIGMVAGGSGITPMLQIIYAIVDNKEDKTEINLVFANVKEEDIMLKKELDAIAKAHSNFKVYYVLDKPPTGWKQGTGYITQDMLASNLPPATAGSMVLVCGPSPMVKMISGDKQKDEKGNFVQGPVDGLLKNLGFTADKVYKF